MNGRAENGRPLNRALMREIRAPFHGAPDFSRTIHRPGFVSCAFGRLAATRELPNKGTMNPTERTSYHVCPLCEATCGLEIRQQLPQNY